MPLNRYVVRVDPQGQSVTVDILDTSGASVVVYDSPQFAAAPRTLPMVITAQTDFWLHNPGPYDVSCKVGGAEVADAGAPKRVQVSDVPVLVVPDWERERTAASSGGSSAVFGSVQFVTSGPLFGPEQTFVIDTANGAQVTLMWGPVTLPAGGHVVAKMGLVIVSEGGPTFALAAGTAEIVVTNLAGAEKLGVENASTDVTSLTAVPWDAGAIDEQIGSDLSVDGVTPSKIVSAAGGQFLVCATFSPTYTA